MTRTETFLLYISIFLISIIFASLSQRRRNSITGEVITSKGWFFLSFLVLWFFSAFANIGVDYNNYIKHFLQASWDFSLTDEFGYILLNMFVRFLAHSNYDVGLFLIKTIGLSFYFIAFWKFRKHLNLTLAVFAFVLLLYLRFYIMAMHIACGLVFISVAYLVIDNKKDKSILIFLLACTVHRSAFLLLPIYAFVLFWDKARQKRISKFVLFMLIVIYTGSIIGVSGIYVFLINKLSVFGAYSQYGEIIDYGGSGIMQFVFYVPLLYIAIIAYKGLEDKGLSSFMLLVTITGLFYALLGYKLEVIVRMSEYFMIIIIGLVPMILQKQKLGQLKPKGIRILNYKSAIFLWIIYVGIRGFNVLFDILQESSSANMANWRFFWPF